MYPLATIPPAAAAAAAAAAPLANYIFRTAHACYYYTVAMPLTVFYLNAPAMLGGWDGKSTEDICGALTQIDSGFWALHVDTCQELLERKAGALVAWVSVVIYAAAFLRFFLRR